MHQKVLPRRSRDLLDALESLHSPAMSGWVLAGGAGLALQLGHRVAEGLALFRGDVGHLAGVREAMESLGPYETLRESERELTVLARDVKLSFYVVRGQLLHESHAWRFLRVAHERDIALMKLAAVSARGARRDFVDLYSYLRGGPRLDDLLGQLPAMYGEGRVNSYHVLKSLAYFEDAEQEPMPEMLQPFDWEECKAFFVRAAHEVVL